MNIHGLQKTTLLDFPGKVACTVFTGGCNLRCPFCHNASLVLSPSEVPTISEEEFFSFLKKRQGILDGVCITGGEPLLQKDIKLFIQKIRDMGFAVKLDTNGTFPERLSELLEAGLVDYVAMDVKNSPERYHATCGVTVDLEKIRKSIDLLMSSSVPYEFRTTVVYPYHSAEDLIEIAKLIRGAKRYFLQSFTDSGDLIGENMGAYKEDDLRALLPEIRAFIPSAELRGV